MQNFRVFWPNTSRLFSALAFLRRARDRQSPAHLRLSSLPALSAEKRRLTLADKMTRRSKRKESEPGANGAAANDATAPAPKKAKEKEKASTIELY